MRLFQNSSLYPTYARRWHALAVAGASFAGRLRALRDDLYGGLHMLKPVLDEEPTSFFAIGHDEISQRAWADEQGMPSQMTLQDILLAQIEQHRTEVFYNLDPVSFPGDFARRLPGNVKVAIAWRAAPSGNTDFRGYHRMVCNFPLILRKFELAGLQTAMFWPAFDPRMATFAANALRPIDVTFVGSFSRHHLQRTKILEMVANLAPRFKVALHLENSRFTRLAEFPLWSTVVPQPYKRPPQVRKIARGPVFGRELYELLARSKIVVNASIDMAGHERGNLRCYEALGTGALLLTDSGEYPDGMHDGSTMRVYPRPEDIASCVQELLSEPATLGRIATAGADMLRARYSKHEQWRLFERIVADVTCRVPDNLSRAAGVA